MAQILVCRKSFVRSVDGRRVSVGAGDLVYSNDPVVVGSEHLFLPIEDRVRRFGPAVVAKQPIIEQATAAPGEKRNTVRRTPKKADESVKADVKPEEKKPEEKKDGKNA